METTAINKGRSIMSWRSSLRAARIRNSSLTDNQSWCMTGSNHHGKLMAFFYFLSFPLATLFLGTWVAKQRKLTFSWLLINCMTAPRVCYKIVHVITCLLTCLTLLLLCQKKHDMTMNNKVNGMQLMNIFITVYKMPEKVKIKIS